ncbi:hypothetical protein [Gardnerella sp. Marseille-Q2328]|uniref:hypothetical protein n=1 Tax=Gardnerella sp. Marseille-Q2328 TaxID=2759694 RepID=UPI0020244E89|nr:hypothetical protein [Gardnerella sp. Marseille-Q2328]
MEVTKSKQEYKKLKKLLKKAYKASVKCNQLNAFIEDAKKNFPGYTEAYEAYDKSSYNTEAAPLAALKRVSADFYEAYAEQLDKYSTIARKACDLRLDFEKMLNHAGEKESEEE